jgi:hypothetical protein
MHALTTLVAATAVSLSLGACASSGGGMASMNLGRGPVGSGTQLVSADNAVSRSPADAPATVRVANYNWMDVNVYAVQGTMRQRLGTVTSMSSAVFRLPQRFLVSSENMRLMVDPIGSNEGYMTDGILVRGGQQISFNVQNALQFSSISVASR